MLPRFFVISLMSVIFLQPGKAFALTMAQFSQICESTPGDCGQHPTLQAYVGGALDLLATLNEETKYLNRLYCKAPNSLFDVPAIIHFMQAHRQGYESRNAMLLVVLYFEENGGCEQHE